MALLLYGHLSIIFASSTHHRRGWALGVTVVVVGLSGLLTYAGREDFSSSVDITVPLKSLGTSWVPTVSTEEFLDRSRRTKTWVDEAISNTP